MPIAIAAVVRTDELFAIEREINGQPPSHRLVVRQKRSRPIIDRFETWARGERKKLSSKGPLAKAIDYTFNACRTTQPSVRSAASPSAAATGPSAAPTSAATAPRRRSRPHRRLFGAVARRVAPVGLEGRAPASGPGAGRLIPPPCLPPSSQFSRPDLQPWQNADVETTGTCNYFWCTQNIHGSIPLSIPIGLQTIVVSDGLGQISPSRATDDRTKSDLHRRHEDQTCFQSLRRNACSASDRVDVSVGKLSCNPTRKGQRLGWSDGRVFEAEWAQQDRFNWG